MGSIKLEMRFQLRAWRALREVSPPLFRSMAAHSTCLLAGYVAAAGGIVGALFAADIWPPVATSAGGLLALRAVRPPLERRRTIAIATVVNYIRAMRLRPSLRRTEAGAACARLAELFPSELSSGGDK